MDDILLALIILLFIPWTVVTMMWYVSIAYRFFMHKEEEKKTGTFAIKILTVGDDPETVSRTVAHCPVLPTIVSRTPTGLRRNVVLPSAFTSRAQFKGEQLEWARRKFPSNYKVYLDEDSICSPEMRDIPDADIVQFRETPVASNWYTAAIEAHRIGFQAEQALFEKVKPFYLWGGGFAIKRWVEDATTWDRESITEDTAFIFRAPQSARFVYSKIRVFNQAPPTLRALIKQRRRWASGTYNDVHYHPDARYRAWILVRAINWGSWPLVIPASIFLVVQHPLFLLPVVQTAIWSYAGAREMQLSTRWTLLAIATAPIAALFHSLGATAALVWRQKTFNVTPKLGFQLPVLRPSLLGRRELVRR
jgi:hypothetical protein